MNQASSELERKWLRFLDALHLSLPERAQVYMQKFEIRADFVYDGAITVIYVDGPIHDYPERAERNASQRESLWDFGYTVIVFRHQDDWRKIISGFPGVFGAIKDS